VTQQQYVLCRKKIFINFIILYRVKVKINTFEKILNVWLQIEECLKCLRYQYSNLKRNNIDDNFDESNLNVFILELNNFESYLSKLKNELILSNCFSLNTTITDTFNTYLIEMEHFKAELSFITKFNKENMKQDVKMNYTKSEERRCHDPNCENFKRNYNFKTATTTTTTENKYDDSTNEMMTNIHLDFQMNDSIDENNYQMTSTPRYNHYRNTANNKQTSLLQPKTFCDKSMATVDDKSSQTDFIVPSDLKTTNNKNLQMNKRNNNEKRLYQSSDFNAKNFDIKKNLNTHRSLDSGIMCGLDNTTASFGLGSYSSSSPLSYSFGNKTGSSELIRKDQDQENNIEQVENDIEKEIVNLELNKKEEQEEQEQEQEQEEETCLRNRTKLNKCLEEEEDIKTSQTQEESEFITTSLDDEINFTKTELEILNNEDLNENRIISSNVSSINNSSSNSSSERKGDNLFFRLFKYLLMFIMFICIFVFIIMPILMPSCCDFRREFLIFNEKNYNYDDTPLPF